MPVPMLKSLAKKSGKSLSDAEKYWEEAKTSALKKFNKKDNRYWAYVAGIVKQRMGLSESISFKEFLNETMSSSDEKFSNDTYKVLLQLKKDCQQFLKESDGQPLFRGSRSARKFKKYETLDYRSPTNSLNLDMILFNAYVERQWDIKNIRSHNSLFTTGSAEHAAYYGQVYLVFPCDGYEYIWSKEVTDLYDTWALRHIADDEEGDEDEINTAIEDLTIKMSKAGLLSKMPTLEVLEKKYSKEYDVIRQPLYHSLYDLDFQCNQHLDAAISTGNEIIFQTKHYYSLDAEDMMEYLHIITPKDKMKGATNLNKVYQLFLEKISEI
jgi:hypothetical protein